VLFGARQPPGTRGPARRLFVGLRSSFLAPPVGVAARSRRAWTSVASTSTRHDRRFCSAGRWLTRAALGREQVSACMKSSAVARGHCAVLRDFAVLHPLSVTSILPSEHLMRPSALLICRNSPVTASRTLEPRSSMRAHFVDSREMAAGELASYHDKSARAFSARDSSWCVCATVCRFLTPDTAR
jgi:hypothetical protein